jgi:uncharacterized protein YgiB involved in biofilm formation
MLSRLTKHPNLIAWLVMGFVGVASLGIGAVLVLRPANNFAVALATPQDCLRAFDDDTCRKLVKQALDIHYKRAPQYRELRTCEMVLGAGACVQAESALVQSGAFVPAMVAVLVSKAGPNDASSLVPLYQGKAWSGRPAGAQTVYFSGTAVGNMTSQRFGGAAITQVRDKAGAPITVERLQQLRRLAR